MNRLNKYIHFISVFDNHFIYDISSERAIALSPELYDILRSRKDNIDSLRSVHPELYSSLSELGMIIDNNTDETEELIRRFKDFDSDPSKFDIILNPTLDCNLRCWYCYETHGRGTMMHPETISAVRHLIDSRLTDQRLKHLSLTFFGGEPLLGWRKVVMPLLEYATRRCGESNVVFTTGFTTNGVLLSESKYNELLALGLSGTPFQITFDGNRIFHNGSRIGEARIPTYDTIMNNVISGATMGFKMSLRFNYTPETLPSFIDVLSDLEALPENYRQNVTCNFQKVWQLGCQATREDAIKYVDLFNSAGFQASSDITYWRYVCYADRENQITINYNGDLFKCTAREFMPESREGILTDKGTLLTNERYSRRMALKYSNPVCRECNIFPLCGGRCSQHKIESPDMRSCMTGYNERDKENIIKGSLIYKVFNRLLPIEEIELIKK